MAISILAPKQESRKRKEYEKSGAVHRARPRNRLCPAPASRPGEGGARSAGRQSLQGSRRPEGFSGRRAISELILNVADSRGISARLAASRQEGSMSWRARAKARSASCRFFRSRSARTESRRAGTADAERKRGACVIAEFEAGWRRVPIEQRRKALASCETPRRRPGRRYRPASSRTARRAMRSRAAVR